jgi:hypothetical protein
VGLPTFRGRRRRIFGPRQTRIPYFWLGWITIAIGITVLVIFIARAISGLPVGNYGPLPIVLMITALGSYWIRLAGRLKNAPVALKAQGSVLYLRAFDDEARPFITGPSSDLRQLSSRLWSSIQPRRGNPILKLTLEEFLGEAISKQLGPFIALGNPGDPLPPPGAVREYAEDFAWKNRFTELADSAICIVLSAGNSTNLDWELTQIRQRNTGSKLCVFVSPRGAWKTVSKGARAEDHSRNALLHTWHSATEVLRRAGFECEPVCPGFGAVLSFDDTGKTVLLTTDASTPEEYVMPAAAWIKSGARIGKCISTTCASCRSVMYTYPNTPLATCFACAQKAQLEEMSILKRALDRYPFLQWVWLMVCGVVSAITLIDPLSLGPIEFIAIVMALYLSPLGLSAGIRWLKTGSFKY